MNMPQFDVTDLNQDSPDLTDAEVEGAVVTASYGELRYALIHLSCASCGVGPLLPHKHALRRRKPGIYWRMTLACGEGHEVTKTYRADWLEPNDGEQ